jgi:hypothetical protein
MTAALMSLTHASLWVSLQRMVVQGASLTMS